MNGFDFKVTKGTGSHKRIIASGVGFACEESAYDVAVDIVLAEHPRNSIMLRITQGDHQIATLGCQAVHDIEGGRHSKWSTT